MATTDRRSGFTWVELVVVILIVTVLVALLLPAVESARESGRRAMCISNGKFIALSLMNYESVYHCFPGYVNRVGKDPDRTKPLASWVVPMFPYMERNDLWNAWIEGRITPVSLPWLICPSDPSQATPGSACDRLSYVANCGRPGDEDSPAHGIFHNYDVDADPVLVNFEYLSEHDGSTYTILVSENIQAGLWTDTDEANVGMVWLAKPERCSPINRCLDAGDRPQDIQYARPSSRHGRGVVVSFCDGHQEFLRDNIDYQVYQHLMTPDSQAAGVAGTFDPNDL